MKRIVVILTIALLLVSARGQNTRPAYYYGSAMQGDKLPNGELYQLNAGNFQAIKNGVVTLNDGVFITSYTGMMHVSGSCETKKPPSEFRMSLRGMDGNVIATLTRGDDYVSSFSVVFPAQDTTIDIVYWGDVAGTNPFNCNVLFEAVK